MSKSISWHMGQEVSPDLIRDVNGVKVIKELTVTRIRIPVEFSGDEMKVRLYNTDPVNWNLFMTPYTSEKVRANIEKDELLESLQNPREFLLRYVDQEELDDDYPLPIRFEVKKSKSTGKNTLYVFLQKVIPFTEDNNDFERREFVFKSEEDIKSLISNHKENYAVATDETLMMLWRKYKNM